MFRGDGEQPMTSVLAPRIASAISRKAALFQTRKVMGRRSSTAVRSSPGLNCKPPSPIRQTTGTPDAATAAPTAAPGPKPRAPKPVAALK